VALLTALIVTIAVAAACGESAPSATEAPAAPPTAVPAATAAGAQATPTAQPEPTAEPAGAVAVQTRLRVLAAVDRENNDPPLALVHQTPQYHGTVFETLFDDDNDFLMQNMLVTDWSVTPDGKTWEFQLRKGVPFHHDWGEFTAKDLLHTMQRYTREESVNATLYHMHNLVDHVEIVDDYNVTLNLPDPFLDGQAQFSGLQVSHILSKDYFDAEGQEGVDRQMIGTGPYRFVERVLGSHILHERVTYDHWRIAPDFEELQIFIVLEPSTQLANLLAGEADLGRLPFDLQGPALDGGLKVVESTIPSTTVYAVFGGNYSTGQHAHEEVQEDPTLYNPDFPWAIRGEHGRKVREALNRAVNREELKNTVLGGRGQVMPVTFYLPFLNGWNPEWLETFDRDYGYDPERAKELLAEVEADRGEPLDWSNARYWLSPRPELAEVQDVGEAVANYWQAIGVPIKIEERELAYAAEQFFARRISGIAWTDATPFRETDREQLRIIYASVGCCEFYSDDVVNENYNEFLASVDLAERDRILRETGNHLYEQYSTVPLVALNVEFIINPDVIAEYETSGFRPPRKLEYIKAVKK
jgi:ABC-type transport system substrate-binding protein